MKYFNWWQLPDIIYFPQWQEIGSQEVFMSTVGYADIDIAPF